MFFPQELIDEILSYLVDSRNTLKACCLTSSQFVHTCQKFLLTHIRIFPERDALQRPTGADLQLLLKESPHIAPYVHYLAVIDTGHFVPHGDWFAADDDATLRHCLPLLCNLKALSVQSQGYAGENGGDRRGIFPRGFFELMQFPTITYLDLLRVPMDLLNYCPNLKHLSLCESFTAQHFNNRPVLDAGTGRLKEKTMIYLESLKVSDSHRPVLSLMAESEIDNVIINISRLKKLHVYAKTAWSHTYIASLLSCCTSSLEEFVFHAFTGGAIWKPDYVDPINWRSLSNLKTFYFKVHGTYGRYNFPPFPLPIGVPRWVMHALYKLASTSLEHLILTF